MSHRMGDAYNYMSTDMRTKLANYMTTLEHRYGDPRVYQMQQDEMAADRAALLHSQVKTREDALHVSYGKDREGLRAAHKARMVRFDPYKRPQSEPDRAPDHSESLPAASESH